MNLKTIASLEKNVMNFFGALGYLFCSLQWLWVLLLNFSVIKALMLFLAPNNSVPVAKPTSAFSFDPSPLLMIIVAIITIVTVLLTIYVIVKIPSTIVDVSKKAVRKTAENASPIVLRLQHKKDTKKSRIKLTPRLVLAMKAILVVSPVVLSFVSQLFGEQPFDFIITAYVSLGLACFSAVSFAIQYILANLLTINRQDLW